MIRFSWALIEKETVHRSGELPAEVLELAPEDPAQLITPVFWDLTAQKTGPGDALIRGKLHFRYSGVCGRCVEMFEREAEVRDFEVLAHANDAGEIDVTEDVREEALLALPVNPLCDEQCKGLCPHCGTNWNVSSCRCRESAPGNPVWDVLDGL